MIHLCNYAHKRYTCSQRHNTQSGMTNGGISNTFEWGYDHLGNDFKEKNKEILAIEKGAGLWVWKPYIIWQSLKLIGDRDFLFYSDSGIVFLKNLSPLAKICAERTSGIMSFHMEKLNNGNLNVEAGQTKRDIFILCHCDNEEVKTGRPKLASYSMWRKTQAALDFLQEWMYHVEDIRCIGEGKSVLGEEDPRFITHRHDQSVYSTLINKYKFPSFRDCSQWGNPFMKEDSSEYPQLLNHHRISIKL